MADTVAPLIEETVFSCSAITDATAEMPPFAQMLAGLTLLVPDMLTSMPDMSDPNPLIAASDDTSTALMLGVAPAHAAAVGHQALAHSLSLLMLGDANAHNTFAATSNAIVAASVKLLLETGAHRG
jgi:hypothetical protein